MNIYTTYGTYGYLNQIRTNNTDRNLFLFSTNDSSVIIEAIVFLSNQNLITEFIHVFVLIVDRNLIITVQRI